MAPSAETAEPERSGVDVDLPPSNAEFQEALSILKKDPSLGADIRSGRLRVYRPMPPIVRVPEVTSRGVAVGLSRADGTSGEIVAVHVPDGRVTRFPGGAPRGALAAAQLCGGPSAGQTPTQRGTGGQYQVTIKDASGALLWSFLVLRPSVSTGIAASGIEVRNVDYKGRRVLGRGHVPILNVAYIRDLCGPFRDWTFSESMFVTVPAASNPDPAPGFRICASRPQTILDTGNDIGNFQGVAVYVDPQTNAVFLFTELEAGWYRYINQWGFWPDGRIQPRMGFGSTQNACVCYAHVHHAYWRLDFDVATVVSNVVGRIENGNSTRITSETSQLHATPSVSWSVGNTVTPGGAWDILPGARDGTADAFGVADFWALRSKPTEIDDGVFCGPCSYGYAHLNDFVDETLDPNGDLVVWYAAHFAHDAADEDHEEIGPDLVPVLPCASAADTLCLVGSRFRIQVAYKNQFAGGAPGTGTAAPLTADTGTFWFFNAANVEIVVKVLDGRAVNGRFWVISGALTDLEYTLSVIDTQTGLRRAYYNPPGVQKSVVDTSSF